jgi:hypothetical protein
MAFRLAVACLAALVIACGDNGGGGGGVVIPQAQWGRERGDISNTGQSGSNVTNTAP